MDYKVIRHKQTGKIESFGPNRDSYDCPFDSTTHTLTIEPFEIMWAEWDSYPKPLTPRQAARQAIQDYLDGTLTARDAIAAIKDAL